MTKARTLFAALTLAFVGLLVGWTTFHIEVTASFPKEDAVLTEVPGEVWLEFNVEPDMERSSFSIRGPDGRVELVEMSRGEDAEVITARVAGDMPAGSYTVSWIAAPLEDHTVRGRYSFEVAPAR